jgi:hypothetical protein
MLIIIAESMMLFANNLKSINGNGDLFSMTTNRKLRQALLLKFHIQRDKWITRGVFEITQRTNKGKRYECRKSNACIDITGDELPYMESLYGQVKDEVDNMQCTRQHLSNDIHAL